MIITVDWDLPWDWNLRRWSEPRPGMFIHAGPFTIGIRRRCPPLLLGLFPDSTERLIEAREVMDKALAEAESARATKH